MNRNREELLGIAALLSVNDFDVLITKDTKDDDDYDHWIEVGKDNFSFQVEIDENVENKRISVNVNTGESTSHCCLELDKVDTVEEVLDVINNAIKHNHLSLIDSHSVKEFIENNMLSSFMEEYA